MKLADFTPYAKWMSASKALVEPVHRRASSKKEQKKAMLAPEIVSDMAIDSDISSPTKKSVAAQGDKK